LSGNLEIRVRGKFQNPKKIPYNAPLIQNERATIMKRILLIMAFFSLSAFVLAKEISRPATPNPSPTQTVQALQNGGINTPFSNAEESFYQKAWPIQKSHGAYALILMGGVLIVILTLLIRKMAQSGPRKPPPSA
jgi:hypothetical protein